MIRVPKWLFWPAAIGLAVYGSGSIDANRQWHWTMPLAFPMILAIEVGFAWLISWPARESAKLDAKTRRAEYEAHLRRSADPAMLRYVAPTLTPPKSKASVSSPASDPATETALGRWITIHETEPTVELSLVALNDILIVRAPGTTWKYRLSAVTASTALRGEWLALVLDEERPGDLGSLLLKPASRDVSAASTCAWLLRHGALPKPAQQRTRLVRAEPPKR